MNPSLARASRISTLFVPSVLAWGAACIGTCFESGHSLASCMAGHPPTGLVHAIAEALLPLWLVMTGALIVRLVEGGVTRRGVRAGSLLDHLDVLTSTGRAIMWSGAAAVVAATFTGWASLAVVGMLGLGVVYVSVTWSALVAGGDEPWRGASVHRTILPEVAVEGDALREEVRLSGVRIPAGYRLFARGPAAGRGTVESRYVVGSDAAGAEVRLESGLGPAARGEHALPPLELWLQDLLGLTRTPLTRLGVAAYTALPRPASIDGGRKLLGRGGDDQTVVDSRRLPTEGYFRLREYVPGDDARRIHWARSLAARQLVVRQPDEIPPAEPAVRLILDTHLVGAGSLASDAPGELLDAMVRVWLGLGRSLAEAGIRVNLVAAASGTADGAVAKVERPMRPRAFKEALRLGARVAWQPALPVAQLLGGDATRERQVVVTSRPRPVAAPGVPSAVQWVVVPEMMWTAPEILRAEIPSVVLPFPLGSVENRPSRRARARAKLARARRDRAIFRELLGWQDPSALPGAWLARPAPMQSGPAARATLEVIQ